ncbi:5'-methylthioadenosine/S-adenosylhomocysteine nucleosidase [Streptomyces sp. NBC_00554]|uniref:5'-methylthioadenosine/S-adenosylhomocysteine nucleosidase family protein n=1 Tax=Streptomyces sp. NBC_00554 TaxID=2903661 RepID=UPI00352F8A9B|nr:5'-methylthioadenosine/S-adenosylhomocysteine nucleosidase [Streptomyces sp. NBC_00554]
MGQKLGITEPAPDIAVFTALPVERQALLDALGPSVRYRWQGQDLNVCDVDGTRVLVLPPSGMGNVGIAALATRAIGVWNPAQLLLVGIAGGVRGAGDDLRLGDVLVPDQVVGYELSKLTVEGPKPRYETYRPDYGLLSMAGSVEPAEWLLSGTAPAGVDPLPTTSRGPKAHFGPVLSGEKVIADDHTVDGLRTAWPKALGVEMESLGVALAAYRGGPGFLMVKAVCDFADSEKNDDWHDYAAAAAARFSVAVLRRYAGEHGATAGAERPQAVPLDAPDSFPGAVKVQFCRGLVDDWEELADYFGIPLHTKRRFQTGNEPRGVWEWLEVRHKLPLLPQALQEVHPDLPKFFGPGAHT